MVLHAGHEPLIASDGLGGLKLLESQSVDFICVSLSLPDTDGIQFTRQVRSMANGRGVPIVLLSSARDNATRERAFEAGVTDIYPKTSIEELFQRAEHMASQDRQRLAGRVLYIEDSRTAYSIMTRLLEGLGLTVDHFLSAEEAIKHFDPTRHDLVISDILVEGGMSGVALVSQLRQSYPDLTRVPILAMSGMDDDTRRVELFRLGVNDFISKPIIQEEAAARIRNLVVQKQLFDQVQQQRIQLYEMAMTDPLTGLYNRNSLAEFASKMSASANRHNHPLSVIIIDLDHFKALNDEHGHLVGDQALAAVGSMLRDNCRAEDFAVRFGGEEMLLVMPHCSGRDALARAEQIRRQIHQLCPAGITISASFGVSARHSDQILGLEQLIRQADQALYEAKAGGRNRAVMFSNSNPNASVA
jgi:two-component system, cell cycle response regulator